MTFKLCVAFRRTGCVSVTFCTSRNAGGSAFQNPSLQSAFYQSKLLVTVVYGCGRDRQGEDAFIGLALQGVDGEQPLCHVLAKRNARTTCAVLFADTSSMYGQGKWGLMHLQQADLGAPCFGDGLTVTVEGAWKRVDTLLETWCRHDVHEEQGDDGPIEMQSLHVI